MNAAKDVVVDVADTKGLKPDLIAKASEASHSIRFAILGGDYVLAE